MRSIVFVTIALLALGAAALRETDLAVHTKLVNDINAAATTWKASTEQGAFFANATIAQVRAMLGARLGSKLLPRKTDFDPNFVAPASFDASQHWSNCPTIMNIRDQSACGSCWAVAAAATISDRYCTQGNQPNVSISAVDILACCLECGMGCNGGYPGAAMHHWVSVGYRLESCQPYPFPRCEHHIPAGKYPACPSGEYPTPNCPKGCKDGSSPKHYKGTKAYGVSGEAHLQQELMTNGPIEVAFSVYADFPTYKSGVYRHTTGEMLGGHAVKLIGWGVTETGDKYWIINNSWNEDWGNHGQFWIARGNDECGIEDEGSAGHV